MTTTTESPKRAALIRQMVQFLSSLQRVPEDPNLWPLTPSDQAVFIRHTLCHARTIWTTPEFMLLRGELALEIAMQEAVQTVKREKKRKP